MVPARRLLSFFEGGRQRAGGKEDYRERRVSGLYGNRHAHGSPVSNNGTQVSPLGRLGAPAKDSRWRPRMAVTIITVFSVPKGKEDDFVKWW